MNRFSGDTKRNKKVDKTLARIRREFVVTIVLRFQATRSKGRDGIGGNISSTFLACSTTTELQKGPCLRHEGTPRGRQVKCVFHCARNQIDEYGSGYHLSHTNIL